MSDILIRGIEMPKRCLDCDFSIVYGDCCCKDTEPYECEFNKNSRPDWCPLIELPEHGDLIDMDEIIEQIEETPFTMSMFLTVKECRAAINAKEVILNVVAYADAVIPSNKEETE